MTVEEFEVMEVGVFFLKLFYFNQEQDRRERWNAELVRLQTMQLVNLQLAKGSQIKDPKLFWHFPWEDEPENRDDLTKKSNYEQLIAAANKVFDGI